MRGQENIEQKTPFKMVLNKNRFIKKLFIYLFYYEKDLFR